MHDIALTRWTPDPTRDTQGFRFYVKDEDSSEQWSEWGMGKGSLAMCADGRMIAMSDRGQMVIARANPKSFETIARAQVLPRSMCRTVAVLSNGRIYARNAKGNLVCLDVQ